MLRKDLLSKCQELGLINYKSKNKSQLIKLIVESNANKIIILTNDFNENTLNLNKNLKLIDLFAGTGAFSYVFNKTNRINTILANDILDSSEEIYNLNHRIYNINLKKKDILLLEDNELPKTDIITAGFSCQPFSIAGNRKGFDDIRSNVFWKILDIIKITDPKIIILENVKNLQSHDDGKTFKIIIDSLKDCNYHIKYSILNTSKITEIPQNRERIYIICFKEKEMCDKFDFNFLKKENKCIKDFLENEIPLKYYYNNSYKIYDELQKNVIKNIDSNTIYQYRRYYVRENKNNVCPTLTANMGGGGHNVPILLDYKGIRKLTPRECFNLQGFPKDYELPNISDSKLYSLAGNSVSIPIIELICNKLLEIYN